jgi:uncharacterized RmlC-like cupin family protein
MSAQNKTKVTIEPATPTCKVIRADDSYRGKQGLDYFAGISAESAGATGLCMHLVKLPPGARAKAHLHENHETAIFVISGEVEMLYGDNLEHRALTRAGEFVYIPAGVPHVPFNTSSADALAVIARTDPHEQESVRLLPELDKVK